MRSETSNIESISPAAIPRLLDELQSHDWEAQREALQALIKIGAPAVEPLLERLNGPPSRETPFVISALGVSRDTRAVEPIIRLLREKTMRMQAARVLGWFHDVRALLPLLRCLHDPNPDVRVAAIFALGILGEPRALPALRRVARKRDKARDWDGATVDKTARDAIKRLIRLQRRARQATLMPNKM